MMHKTLATLLLTTSFCLGAGSLTAQAGTYMSADEVKNVIVGKSANGVHLKKDFAYRIYFAPDGALHQIKENGVEKKGQWSVTNDGKHCVEWDNSGVRKCFPVRDDGDGTYTKVKLKGNRVIEILRWSDFQDGDALK
jgi:hypothetical protein